MATAKTACDALSSCKGISCKNNMCSLRASTKMTTKNRQTSYTKKCDSAGSDEPGPAPAEPSPAPATESCTWQSHKNKLLDGHATGSSTCPNLCSMATAKTACDALNSCKGISCKNNMCSLRASTGMKTQNRQTSFTKKCDPAGSDEPGPAP